MANASRDQNFVTTLLAVSNVDGTTPVAVYADPTTHRLLTNASGGGTVTSVSVTTANGVSGSVATATTTPAITLTLGAITPTSVNGLTITSSTGTLTITNAKTVAVTNSLTFSGSDGTTMTFPSTSATIARTDAANTFTGHQTIEGVTSTGATGTGKFVFDGSPTLVTPVLGVATATSINKVAFTAPTTAATFAFGTDNATQTFQGTDTIVGRATTDTLTNKTLTTPTITKPVMSATNPTAQTYSPAGAGTATLDLSLSNQHDITMPAGNITIALSNDTNNQVFMVSILQDSGGSRTVTWFTTIRWAGGGAPTLTTTASKRDVFGFKRTGSGTYDGFIIGQNI